MTCESEMHTQYLYMYEPTVNYIIDYVIADRLQYKI